MAHRPVLLDESLAALAIDPAGVYVDATFGRGGHSGAILERLNESGRLYALDRDPEAVAHGRAHLADEARFTLVRAPFSELAHWCERWGITGRVAGVLLDVGVSSPQLDQARRGFSFLADGPLDMRMDPDSEPSAAQWLALAGEDEIARVLKTFGEERYARRIARAIVAAREREPLQGTRQLAEVVARAHPAWEKGRHPATRTFQAIRIFVNRELDELQAALEQSLDVLAPGGRLAVISFHSLEDRLVKRFIQREARGGDLPPDLPVTTAQLQPRLRPVGKLIRPGEDEVAGNPRARSARLRVAERLA